MTCDDTQKNSGLLDEQGGHDCRGKDHEDLIFQVSQVGLLIISRTAFSVCAPAPTGSFAEIGQLLGVGGQVEQSMQSN